MVNVIIYILAIIGLATLCCGIMLAVAFSRSKDTEEDRERHRKEDEEQMEYIRKWKERHGK